MPKVIEGLDAKIWTRKGQQAQWQELAGRLEKASE